MTQGRGTTRRSRRTGISRRHRQAAAGALVAALALGGTVVAATASTSPSAGAQLQSVTASPYAKVLGNSKHFSLYVLSVESATKLHCKAGCTPTWPPFLVKSSVKKVSLGAGVKGKIGFVKRTATMKQVTFNGFPVYRYAGDLAAGQAKGEGIAADGGTWFLARASARTNAATEIPVSGGTTTTTYIYKY